MYRIIRLETVDSTNNYAANLLKQGKIGNGTVILTGEQTAGKGQRGAVWESEPGSNLLFSVVVIPDNLAVEDQQSLMHLVTLSLLEVLRNIGISAAIKWPNDIYAGDSKIAGILIENQLQAGLVQSSVIGIGLNVNQKDFRGLKATSVYLETGQYRSIEEVLFSFLELFFKGVNIQLVDKTSLRAGYLKNLYRMGEKAQFEDASGIFTGIITGTDHAGNLLIKVGDLERSYDLKEVRFI